MTEPRMTPEKVKELRHPFPPESIGKRPQVTCGACTQAAKAAKTARDKHCDQHQVTKCNVCQAYITTGHLHLDFVGHAVTTSRLLSVDPEWTWEPMGFDATGLPATDQTGNLWIRLTILGVTRPGVGDGASAKEAIGDAIRNAAMRFGVALELWSKEELERDPSESADQVRRAEQPESLDKAKSRAWREMRRLHRDYTDDDLKQAIENELGAVGSSIAAADAGMWTTLADELEAR